MKIAFVCTGNTCRSPMAEGIFKKILSDFNRDDISCFSFGVTAFPGDTANEKAVISAKKYGADISSHRSNAFSAYYDNETDIFVCMTFEHKLLLMNYIDKNKIYVLGGGIPDPYGGSQRVYDLCAEKIYKSLMDFYICLNMEIVPFSASFVEGIAVIENECFSAPWTKEGIEAELSNENAHFLCAVSGDKVIGYVGSHEVAGEAYIANIAVLPQFRNYGVASALLESAENGAKSRNCDFISLEVRESNAPAISLYKKRGYKELGVRKNFYSNPQENGLIMTLYFNKSGE